MSKEDDEYEADYQALIKPPEKSNKTLPAFDAFDFIAAVLVIGAAWYFDYISWATGIVTPIVKPLVHSLLALLGFG